MIAIQKTIADIKSGKGSNSIAFKALSALEDDKKMLLENASGDQLIEVGVNGEEVKLGFEHQHYYPKDVDGNPISVSGKEGNCLFDAFGH